MIFVSTNLTYGGTLQLNRTGATFLTNGQSFKLFNAATYSGSFSSVSTNVSGQFVTWNTSQLPISGTLSVVSVVASTPTNITAVLTGNTLALAWPGSHLGWTLQTNSVGLTATGSWYPYPGSASVTNVNITIDPNETNVFYRLVYP